jgi:hypothetical protein
MTRYLLLLMCLAAVTSLQAQTIDAALCDILSDPQSFDGKVVRVKGTVIAGFEDFIVKDPNCHQSVNAVWLAYPEGTKAKAGPVGFVQLQLAKNSTGTAVAAKRAPVKLDKNKDFKQFDSLLSTPYKGSGMCLGCSKYSVTATLIGRLDGMKETGVIRDEAGKFVAANGFGNMNRYRARLVLQSVADVTGQEIDYKKSAVATKDDNARESSGGDPVAAAHQTARAFSAGNPAAEQVEQAAAAYGKPGEDNGVVIGFGISNEIPQNDGGKGDRNSPDGLLLNCSFDMDRLKGDALVRAISHIGTHIADIRGSRSSLNPFQAEQHAWQTTVLSAVASGQKTLTLAGGYVVWNSAWAPADRNKMMDEAISSFLTTWAAFGN